MAYIRPDFCALFNEWEEELKVGMVVPEGSTEVEMMEGNTEEWGNFSGAIVPWNPNQSLIEAIQVPTPICMEPLLQEQNAHVEIMTLMDLDIALLDTLPNADEVLRGLASENGEPTRIAAIEQATTDTCASPKRVCPWMGPSSSNVGQGTLEDIINGPKLKAKIEDIVEKLEKAVGDLPNSAANKRIRRSISMAVEEVREFTKKMAEKEAVEGRSRISRRW